MPIPRPTNSSKASSRSSTPRRSDLVQPKIAIALAGGGFLGAAYELGVLAALQEAIDGLDLGNLSQYVGVSAGAYVAAGLANRLTPHQMVRMFVEAEDSENPIEPEKLLKPAYATLGKAAFSAPAGLAIAAGKWLTGKSSFWQLIEAMGNSLPDGFIDPKPAADRMARLFSQDGRSNNFQDFAGRLRILATNIDSGRSVEFGSEGNSDVAISTAISASSAVPGVFVPVMINGERYVDGALNKTLHASVALQAGASLVICINPLIPYVAGNKSSDQSIAQHTAKNARATSLPQLLSQSIRTMIRSRMAVGLEKYAVAFPDAAVLLFEPNSDDAAVFMTSIFSLKSRRQICELAYEQTRLDLATRRNEIEPKLAKVGLRLKESVLKAAAPALVGTSPRPKPRNLKTLDAAATRLVHTLEDLERSVRIKELA